MNRIIPTSIFPLLFFAFLAFANLSFAPDPAPPPPPSSGHGATGNQSPLQAPISRGLVVFLAFGIGLSGWEVYKSIKRRRELKSDV